MEWSDLAIELSRLSIRIDGVKSGFGHSLKHNIIHGKKQSDRIS